MAENTWYDDNSDGTSYRGYGLIADMGPFHYPSAWPLMAPPTVEGTYGDVTFMLALPDPGQPDNPLLAGGGGYPTDVFIAYRYADYADPTVTYENYWNDRVPYVAGSSSPTEFVPGMHLYVTIDWDPSSDGPAAYEPDYYVPPGYASYGQAAFQTVPGRWSDWQPGPVVAHAALPAQSSHVNFYGEGYVGDAAGDVAAGDDYSLVYPPPGIASWDVLGAGADAAAVAGMGNSLPPYGQWWRIRANALAQTLITPRDYMVGGEAHGNEIAYGLARNSGVGIGAFVETYFARADFDPVVPDWDLVGYNPNPGDDYDNIGHQASPPVWPEWLDVTAPHTTGNVSASTFGSVDYTVPASSNLQCWLQLPGGAGEDTISPYLAYPGPPLADLPLPVPGAGGNFTELAAGHEDYAFTRSSGANSLTVETSWPGGSDSQAGSDAAGHLTSVSVQMLPDTLPLGSAVPDGTPVVQLVWAMGWILGTDARPDWSSVPDPPTPLGIFGATATTIDFGVDPALDHPLPGDLITNWYAGSPQPYHYSVGGAAFLDDQPGPSHGHYINYRGLPYLAHNPPWRYWTPNHIEPVIQGDQTYMRLAQRADGGGVAPIRRLAASGSIGSQPRSQQADATRRLTLDHNTFY